MGEHLPSDGYTWLDGEVKHYQEINGQVELPQSLTYCNETDMRIQRLEIYTQKQGFRLGQEQFAIHARQRYRLTQHPSFWLICYRPAELRDQASAQGRSIPDSVRVILRERDILGRNQAQLIRKDFMLYDVPNFPSVTPPGVSGPSQHASANMEYPSNVMAHFNKNQQAAYRQQQQQQQQQRQLHQYGSHAGHHPQEDPDGLAQSGFEAGGFAKRPRRGSHARERASYTAIPQPPGKRFKTEEIREPAAMDFMDAITPRELALHRYVQHHEWLEEILSSPYDTHRIVPPQLGLGRKGELESLTQDFFDAPVNRVEEREGLADPRYIADRKMVEENVPVVDDVAIPRIGKLEDNKAEDFRERANAKIRSIKAEMHDLENEHKAKLRSLKLQSEFKTAEQKVRALTLALMNSTQDLEASEQDDILAEVLQSIEKRQKRTIKPIPTMECVEKGGREEILENAKFETEDHEMSGAVDLDGAQLSTIEDTEPQVATIPTPQAAEASTAPRMSPSKKSPLSGADLELELEPSEPNDDFVMVNKDDAIPSPKEDPSKESGAMNFAALQTDQQPIESTGLDDFNGDQGVNFDSNEFESAIDFGMMDTAGDELSGYAQEIANMGAGKSDDLGLDSPTLQNQAQDFGETSLGQDSSGP